MATRKLIPSQPALPSVEYVSRDSALKLLRVKPQTLYAYVSRGRIRSIQQPGGGRRSLFARADIEDLKARSNARQGHRVAAAAAMRWGEPIIPTAITDISADGPCYRGKSAAALARAGTSFECVAEWLWTGLWLDEKIMWPVANIPSHIEQLFSSRQQQSSEHILWRFALLTLHLGATRGRRIESGSAPDAAAAARQLIQTMVGCIGLLGPKRTFGRMRAGESVSEALVRHLGLAASDFNTRAIEAILILLADHELTGSTFAARVAASSGALLHACVTAALATHSGIEIGKVCDRVEDFIKSSGQAKVLLERVQGLQRTGIAPPGFNHPLYRRGDPRANYLIALAAESPNKSQRLRETLKFLEKCQGSMRLYPRFEMGVAVLGLAIGLPPRAGAGLFAIARTSGWIAHILEQRTAGYMLRPRARFIFQS